LPARVNVIIEVEHAIPGCEHDVHALFSQLVCHDCEDELCANVAPRAVDGFQVDLLRRVDQELEPLDGGLLRNGAFRCKFHGVSVSFR